eukprot:10112601-Alexandrium_andersonii.AAC.1
MALVRVLPAANAPRGELQLCTAQGFGRVEPERSGPAHRGAFGGGRLQSTAGLASSWTGAPE